MRRSIIGWGVGFVASGILAISLLLAILKESPPAEAVVARDPSKLTEVELELILNRIREGDLRAVQNDLPGARRAWSEARRLGEGLWPIHEGLGDSYARARLWDDALREYRTAEPLVPARLPSMKSAIGGKRAAVLAEIGKPLEAIQAYLELDQPSVTGARIVDLAGRSDVERAARLVRERAEVRDPRLFLVLSIILERTGRKTEAAEALGKFSIAVAPWDEATDRKAIEALVAAGKIDPAVDVCRAWAKSTPGSTAPYVLMGNILHQAGRDREAVIAWSSIVDLKPGDAAAHAELGQVFSAAGRIDEAIQQYEAARKARPEDQGPYAQLIGLYQSKGMGDQAEEVLSQGVKRFGMAGELRSKLVATLEERIRALKAQGNLEAVRAQRRRLAELNVPEGGLFDLKVVMTWDARSDVDLDLFEPGGEHVEHSHPHS
ncbi:MAG TPA: tetratricopeptide repeat protein, partial [Planctomycetota bacterium]|nr:tetratricopeptide repeat protein [Planctomycetota bacterium]